MKNTLKSAHLPYVLLLLSALFSSIFLVYMYTVVGLEKPFMLTCILLVGVFFAFGYAVLKYHHSLMLRRELQAFKFAVENSNNTVVITDPKRHIIYANDVFEKTTGYTSKEALGQNPNILKSGKHDPDFYAHMNAVLDRGEKWQGEFINKRKDGSIYYEKASIVPVFIDGKLTNYLAIKLDITRYVEQSLRLRESAAVFDHIEEAIVITDGNSRIRSVNRAFTAMYGYTLEDIAGKNPSILRAKKADKLFYESMWQALVENKLWRGKIHNRRKNGQEVVLWMTIKAVTDEEGRIVSYIAIQTDIKEMLQMQERASYLARHDQLTGLSNRLGFEEQFESMAKLSKRNGSMFGVMFIDLDHFKAINDTLGHDAGDGVLVEAGKRIAKTLREIDVLARFGGDEFVILVGFIRAEAEAALIARRILKVFEEKITFKNHALKVTPSIGISFYPNDGEEYNVLIKKADSAMYEAKKSGKNTFCFYKPTFSSLE
ncbi:diguanylate cyclase [Sulfurospirillum sp. T05]|uniref:Diguanylate cyclase n=1 Tax=Sulfurospirillum tamanense TaxID=2813362 RepID=A0ABS2WV05_9BACT|nr:diguanylate cyclase [Sulfurospirillum tamanensis]MBN2965487.1 diguanylate cyclase [Sulfurospirillum tamanensis]